MSFCNCTFSCGKKGNCCDCLKYHHSLGELPACYFPKDAERTGDRSVDHFIRIYKTCFFNDYIFPPIYDAHCKTILTSELFSVI